MIETTYLEPSQHGRVGVIVPHGVLFRGGSEGRILVALLQQRGEPLDKQVLAQLSLGRKLTLYDRSLDMHVSNLRKKIGPHPDGRPRIVALRSRGYYYSL